MLVPEGTVLRRASASDSPVSLRRTLARNLSSAVRSSSSSLAMPTVCRLSASADSRDDEPLELVPRDSGDAYFEYLARSKRHSIVSWLCLGRSDGFQPGLGSLLQNGAQPPASRRGARRKAPEVTE